MLAVQFDQPGPVDSLRVREVPEPAPAPGEVLIEFEASAINPADVKIRSGAIAPRAGTAPYTLGYDLVGTVARGAGQFRAGTRVIAMSAMASTGRGCWSELVCLPETSIARAPAGIDAAVAAQLPLAGLTALQAVQALGPRPGAHVLVTGAAGAVGRLAVQLLRHHGVVVHGLVRQADQVAGLPAGAVSEPHVGCVPPDTVDGIIDAAGGDFASALRPGGHYVTVVPGQLPSLSGRTGATVLTRESGPMLDTLARLLERGDLAIPESLSFALTDIHRAHHEYERAPRRRVTILR
ncbi:MAG TPA: NADP-dependent oxidoreductase [Amycolatopsis sp.]|nr:NADP-dependent oxidoreductase [Amycolatopsis sp.]